MMKRTNVQRNATQKGFSMMEVMVAVVVVALGLLGLAGLQTKMFGVEMEAYQRSTALLVLENMANAIRADEARARSGYYDDVSCPDSGSDYCTWVNAMSDTVAGKDIGGLIGVQGCVAAVAGTLKTLRVSVAWQGLTPTASPPAELTCGSENYGDEALRRVVSTIVIILNPDDPG